MSGRAGMASDAGPPSSVVLSARRKGNAKRGQGVVWSRRARGWCAATARLRLVNTAAGERMGKRRH